MEDALQHCTMHDREGPISQKTFEEIFKKVIESIAKKLKDQPVIVAHTEKTFDGNGIRELLSNKSELDKVYTLYCHCPSSWHSIFALANDAVHSISLNGGYSM